MRSTRARALPGCPRCATGRRASRRRCFPSATGTRAADLRVIPSRVCGASRPAGRPQSDRSARHHPCANARALRRSTGSRDDPGARMVGIRPSRIPAWSSGYGHRRSSESPHPASGSGMTNGRHWAYPRRLQIAAESAARRTGGATTAQRAPGDSAKALAFDRGSHRVEPGVRVDRRAVFHAHPRRGIRRRWQSRLWPGA